LPPFNNFNMRNKVFKHELVEVVIPANQSPNQINFPDLPNLRWVHLWNITAYFEVNFKGSISGRNMVDSSLFKSSYMTLQLYNGKQFLNQCPIQNFADMFLTDIATGEIFVDWNSKEFKGQRVNWPKSYLSVTGLGPDAEDRSFVFSIWYSDPAEIEKQDAEYEFSKKA